MAIQTFSKFYYGTEISLTSFAFDINEGAGEINISLTLGVFSLEGLASELAEQLNAAGTLTYTVGVDRESRIVTVSASAAFDILIASGAGVGNPSYPVFGFSGTSDLTGQTSYAADTPAGKEYVTQFPPQDYVAAGDRKEKGSASVNVSADGQVEVISFGDVRYLEMNLLFINSGILQGKDFFGNPTGREDAIDFLTFATKRGPIEFMPDRSDSNSFLQCILDKTPEDGKGTKFKLKEETGKNLPNIYRTGKLEFRILE